MARGIEAAALLAEIYGPEGRYEAGALDHLADQMRAFRAFLAKLPEDAMLTVGADEF